MTSEPPPESRRAPHRERSVFSAIFQEAAPLDLRLVGRVVMHATAVGAAAGVVASIFYYALEVLTMLCIDVFTGFRTLRAAGELVDFIDHWQPGSPRPWLVLFLPALGALLASFLVRHYAPECAGAGADATIRAFHQKVSEVRRRVMWVKPVATVLTIVTGGAGGREGPTMQIGGAIGSSVAALFRATQRERRILLVAGMAAGTSAIFRTPLGAALLSVEVLYRDDFEADALVPTVLASVIGYSVFIGIYGEAHLFDVASHYPFVIGHLPLYAVMTVLIGAAGVLFVRSLRGMERWCQRFPPWARAGVGGLGVGILAVTLALVARLELGEATLGGGYGVAQAAITGAPWLGVGMGAAGVLVLLAFVKMLGACLTVGTGGSAGAFGPTIAIGALLGGAFGQAMQALFDDPSIQPGAFALVGMGTLFGGIAHAPLGALVMVCEMAGSYDLLVPLMLAEGIAYVSLRKTSLYRSQPISQQDSPAHPPRILEVLSGMTVAEIMLARRDYKSFSPGTPVLEVMRDVSESTWQDVFPVMDDDGVIVGMITPELLRLLGAEQEMVPWIVAADAMQPAVTIHPDQDLREASQRMLSHGLRELLVVDDDLRIRGFIDEAQIGEVYLEHLA